MSGPIRCGVAGWSYPDWRGRVYPRDRRVDDLQQVARLVDFIEIDTSFYRTPARDRVASWLRRSAEFETRFTAKLPREVTHEGRLEPRTVADFAAAFEPLAAAGRLDALLAQFSYRFAAGDDAQRLLRGIARAFGSIAPLLLEVRHRSWRALDPQRRARDAGFRFVHLDYAPMDSGFAGPDPGLARAPGIEYLRLHGRNRRAWFDADAGRDATYDWLYGAAERSEIERRLAALAASASSATTMAAANNHFAGKAVVLALELRAWVRDEAVDVPQTLLDAYPQLAAIARRAQRGLF